LSVEGDVSRVELDLRLGIEASLESCIVARTLRDGVGTIIDFEYVDLNTHAASYLHLDREHFVGQTIRGLLPNEFADQLVKWLSVVVDTGVPGERWDVPFFNSGSQTMGRLDVRAVASHDVVVYSFRDRVDERSLAERYRLLVENSADIVVVTQKDGVTVWASDSLTSALGWRPEEIIGTPFFNLMDEQSVLDRADHLRRAETEAKFRFRVQLRDKEGIFHHFAVLAHRNLDEHGKFDGISAGLHLIDSEVQSERMARLAEERYRLMAANGTDVVALERRGLIEWASPFMERLMDLKSTDVVGRSLAELVHPDDRTSLQTFYRGGEHPELMTLTLRIRMADSSYRWVAMRSHEVVDDETGEKVRVTSWRDAEGDVAGQRALVASESRFRMLAETATDVVVECDSLGKVSWISPSAQATLGWRADNVVGTVIDQYVSREDASRLDAQRHQIANGQLADPVEVRYLTSTGNVKWMTQQMRQLRGPTVQDDTVVVGLHDIDDVMRLRVLAKETQENFDLLAENVSDVIYRVNLDGELAWVSPSVMRQLGWMVGDLLGHSVLDLVFPEDHARVVAWRQLLHFGEVLDELMIRVRQASGDFVWMKANAQPVHGTDGRVNGVVVALRNCEAEVVTARALRTISAGSRVLTRVDDARELLQQMCQVAVEEGGYLLAWYGKKIFDELRTVKMVASSVGQESYLDGLEVHWREDNLGLGPTGRAMRSGQTCTVSDIDTDATFAPWRENAHRHGFRSAAAIPVVVDGVVDGTWQVYAMEPRAFTPEVLTVLEDMAMEIGFGLARLGGSDV